MMFFETILESLRKESRTTADLTRFTESKFKTFTKANFADLVDRVRCRLTEFGIKQSDRVILYGPNSTRWIACDLAIISLGVVTVSLYHRQDPKEFRSWPMIPCRPISLFGPGAGQRSVKMLDYAFPSASFEEIVFVDADVSGGFADRSDGNAATIIYTSGTSGNPKKGRRFSTVSNIDFMFARTTDHLEKAKKKYRFLYASGKSDRVFHFLPLCFAGSALCCGPKFIEIIPFGHSRRI